MSTHPLARSTTTCAALSFRKILAHAPGDQLTLSEQMAMMVDEEWAMRENRRLARLIRSAHLSVADACLENAWCDPARGLEKSLVRELGTAKWLRNKQNVIIHTIAFENPDGESTLKAIAEENNGTYRYVR